MHSLCATDAAYVLLVTSLELAAAHVASRSLSTQIFKELPLWSWFLSVLHQFVIFPVILCICLLSTGSDLSSWLSAPWDAPSLTQPPNERFLAYLGLSYFCKDMFGPRISLIVLDTPYTVHHIAAIASVLYSFFLPSGGNTLLLMSIVFEFGSGCAAACHMRPKSYSRRAVFLWGMTASNVLALLLTARFFLKELEIPVMVRGSYVAVCVCFALIRQLLSMMDLRSYIKAVAD